MPRPKIYDHALKLTLSSKLMEAIRKARTQLGHETYTTTIRALLKRALGDMGLYEEPEAPLPGEAED